MASPVAVVVRRELPSRVVWVTPVASSEAEEIFPPILKPPWLVLVVETERVPRGVPPPTAEARVTGPLPAARARFLVPSRGPPKRRGPLFVARLKRVPAGERVV